MEKILKNFVFDKNYKKRAIASAVISIFLSLFSVIGQQIETDGRLKIDFISILLFIAFFIIYFVIAFSAYFLFDNMLIKNRLLKFNDYALFFISSGFLFVVYFIFLLGVYPGILAYDADSQFLMYEYKIITEHHPVIHTLLFGYLVDSYSYMDNYNLGAFAYSVIQIILMAFGFSFVTVYVYKKLKNYILWILSILFYAFFPTILLQVLSATKDSMFLAFMMVTVVLSLVLIDYSEKFFDNKLLVFLWVIAFVFMLILRNNCMYASPFLAVGLLIFAKKRRKQTLILLVVAFALFLIYKEMVVPSIVYKKVDSREKLSVPVQQLDRIYNSEDGDLTVEEEIIIENLLDNGIYFYYPRISDYPKALMDIDYYNENKSGIHKAYLKIISKNPKIAVESFLENTLGFWYPYSTLALYPDGKGGYWPVKCWEPWFFESKIPFILNYLEIFGESNFIKNNDLAKTFLYPGSFFYLFAIMFGYAIYKKKTSYNVVFLYTFMLLGTYFLGPVALVRYAIYLYAFVPLYFALVSKAKSKNTELKKI